MALLCCCIAIAKRSLCWVLPLLLHLYRTEGTSHCPATGIAAAYFFATLSPTVDIANAALPAYMVSLLYFSGIVMNFNSIPAYWDWYSRIDFVRYGYTALLINHFEGRDLKLFGQPVLEFYSVDGQSAWANLGYQSIFFFFFAALSYIVLKYVRHDKR
jgi:hypothetical protein